MLALLLSGWRSPLAIPGSATDLCHVYNCSVDETAMAVQKLINDKKNGAVMRLIKPSEDAPLLMQYMEYKWTPIEKN